MASYLLDTLWIYFVDFAALFILPFVIVLLAATYFYHATKHKSIQTVSKGFNHLIGHSYKYYTETFTNNNEHDWIHSMLTKSKQKLLCLSFPFNSKYILINNDSAIVEYLFNKHEKKLFIPRSEFEQHRDILGVSILNSNGAKHEVLKTKIIKFFTQNTKTFNDVFMEHSKLLISKINDDKYHNLNELLLRSCLASFCQIAIGTDLNLIKSYPNNHPFLNAFNQCIFYSNRRYYASYWKILRFLNIGSENVISSAIGLMESIITTLCETQKKKLEKINAINQKLKKQNQANKLRKHSEKSQKKYTKKGGKMDENTSINEMSSIAKNEDNFIDFCLIHDEDIQLEPLRDFAFHFLYSSRDHLALLLSWFFYEITKKENKQKYNLLIGEIMALNGVYNGKKLEYLENCLYETLRLHPVKPWIFRQCMTKIHIPQKFAGNVIERDDILAIHNYSFGRSDKIWKGPLVFEPNRFHSGKKKKFRFCMFGIGLRECMGKDMAIDAAKVHVFNVMKDYDVMPKPDQSVTYTASTVLHMKHGFYAKLKKR